MVEAFSPRHPWASVAHSGGPSLILTLPGLTTVLCFLVWRGYRTECLVPRTRAKRMAFPCVLLTAHKKIPYP